MACRAEVQGVHGAQTIQQCLDAGLLDEIHIDLAAVLLGAECGCSTTREHTGRPRESDSRQWCGVMHLRYPVHTS